MNALMIPKRSYTFPGDQFCKIFKRTVVGFFRILRKKTPRQLSFGQMIRNAITADALAAARFIRAIAFLQIMILFAFHRMSSKKKGLMFSSFPANVRFACGEDFVEPANGCGKRCVFHPLRILLCFPGYGDHGFTERVERFFAFCFCRLNHNGFMYNERKINGRRMIAKVNQTLCHIAGMNAILLDLSIA